MRTLFIDIETAPDVIWSWRTWDTSAIAVKEHWYVLSVAWKWAGDKKVTVKGLCDMPGYQGGRSGERTLLKEIHALLEEADIVVAHNGAQFDVKKLNARFIAHGLRKPAPYKIVDTKRDLKRDAAFSSNKLNWLCKQLDLGSKTMEHHDWAMWQGCMEGKAACWREMKKYNAHDVELLEDLYNLLMMLGWLNAPNAQTWGMKCVNPACRARNPRFQHRGYARTKTRKYRRYQCQSCGKWSRSVVAEPLRVKLVSL